MKKILFTLLFLFTFFSGYSQMNNAGGTVTVESGATLVIEGNYTSTSNGSIEIDGEVQLKGNFINNSGSIATGSTGHLTFTGTNAQEITGSQSTTFYCAVIVDKASNGVALTNTATGANQTCDSTLILTSGKVDLNNFNLTLSDEGVSGFGAGNYIIADSTGQLRAGVGASNYAFPVGSASSYNPVILNEAGTADTFGIKYKGTMPGGWTGTDHAVTGNWTVSEVTAGGCNLTVTPQWNLSQEQASFARTDCAVGVSADNGATVTWTASGAAAGIDPYTRSGAGFTTVGKFLVGDYFFEGIDLDLDMFLAGPLSGSTMTKTLNTSGLIPLTDPYGLSTTVSSIPTDAVDWIKLELRDKSNIATILHSRAFFVDINGNVLNIDGNIGTKLKSITKDQFYVAMIHRNHLGIVSANTIDLTQVSSSYNFSSAQSQAWQDPSITTNGAMKLVGSIYALWNGNANNNNTVKYNGSSNDKNAILTVVGLTTPNNIINGYYAADVNLNGQVKYNGSGNDKNIVLGVVGLTTANNIIYRHLP